MKKEGIMRINSYSKFFAEVAKIMNTDVKAVKQLEGRYKVELANHVYLNVYRGVDGSLFIHDHRGIAHITSCYDFEDFKTMKDLYERLVTDYSESDSAVETAETTATEETVKVKNALNARFGQQMYIDTDSASGKISLPCVVCNHFCVRFDNDRIKMNHCVRKNTENYLKACKNPNWHHVSLKTIANIDRDMIDEKRQCYMYVYHLLRDFRKYALEITRREVYFDLVKNVIKDIQQLYFNNKISIKAYNYASRHIELVSVEKNYFQSKSERAFGYKESKRYSITLR